MTVVTTYSNKNRFGRYDIDASQDVIIVTFCGAFNKALSQKYLQHIQQICKQKHHKPWALSANFADYQALTPDAEKVLLATYHVCLQNNCVADAYCIDSIVGLAQIKKIRLDANVPEPIEHCLFIDEPAATEYLYKVLANLQVQNNSSST